MRKRTIIGIIVGIAIILSGTEKASAANGWEENLVKVDLTTTTTAQVSATAAISMGSGTTVEDLDAANASTNPDEAGKVLSQVATVTVGNTSGFSVYVSGDAALTGRNSSGHKIPSVSSAKTLGSMSNEWGWYGVIGDAEASWNPSTSFKEMSASQQSVGTGGATTSNVTKKVTLFYGARVNNSVAEDYYGNTVTVSVVAQPGTVTTSRPITMQEMTADICRGMNIHETAQLEDVRDGNKYWVTKMLDGNCWMNQNLNLDITASNITPETSDVTRNWTASPYVWDHEYVLNTPTATVSCGYNYNGLSPCSGQGFVHVATNDGWTQSLDPNFYRATNYKGVDGSNCIKPANSALNIEAIEVCRIYDAHYHVGNLYKWNEATAGSGSPTTSAYASESICPKGWKLPGYSDNDSGSYDYMLQQYGTQNKINSAAGAVASPINGDTYDIALSPLFFVRSGYNISNFFYNAGQEGRYWSSRSYYQSDYGGTTLAYSLLFAADYVSPSNQSKLSNGYSLRCLVPTT